MLKKISHRMTSLSGQIQYRSEGASTWDHWFEKLDQLHLVTIHHFELQSATVDLRRPVAGKQDRLQD